MPLQRTPPRQSNEKPDVGEASDHSGEASDHPGGTTEAQATAINPPTSITNVQSDLVVESVVFTPPSARLGAVTKKGNALKELLNSRTTDVSLLKSLYNEYTDKIAVLNDACLEMRTDENKELLDEWINKNKPAMVNLQIATENYLKTLTNTVSQKAGSIKSHSSQATSGLTTRSHTSSARIKLAEKKAKLTAEKFYNERLTQLEKEELQHKQNVRRAQEEKLQIEQNILQEELDKLDDIAPNIEKQPYNVLGSRPNINEDCRHEAPYHLHRDATGRDASLIDVLRKQNEISRTIVRHQEKAELPKKELQIFDGRDVTKYPSFIANFTRIVHNKCDNDADRLYYLEQYTSGLAHDLVLSCNNRDALIAYSRAINVLEEEFGNEHKASTAYLEKLDKWPTIKSEDGEGLRNLSIYLLTCLNNMGDSSALTQLNSPKEIMSVVNKLPYELRKRWRDKTSQIQDSNRFVKFEDLVLFVRQQAKVINQPLFGAISDTSRKSSSIPVNKPKRILSTNASENKKPDTDSFCKSTDVKEKCVRCNKSNHETAQCYLLNKMTYDEVVKFVKLQNLCFACLKTGHTSRGCSKRLTCSKCQKKHPTVLHNDKFIKQTRTIQPTIPESQSNSSRDTAAISSLATFPSNDVYSNKVLCSVVPITIKVDGKINLVTTYAALDTCSTSCFLNSALLKELGVCGEQSQIALSTMENSNTQVNTRIVNNLELYDISGKLQDVVPVVFAQDNWPFKDEDSPKPEDLPLGNESPFQLIDANISVIIGMNRPDMVKPLKIIENTANSTYFSLHKLGWAINGPVARTTASRSVLRTSVTHDIEKQISDMYDHDYQDSHLTSKDISENDRKWHTIMLNSITLKPDKHYEIELPIKEGTKLPCNKGQAYNIFLSLLRKFKNNVNLFKDYNEFIGMMLQNSYMEKVPLNEIQNENSWYLTHHAVYHKEKKKIRIVFNCSLKNKGSSLNDSLYQGPDLTNSLLGVLIRFRQEPVAFMGDISKMFYQVRVAPEHRDYLRFFWLDENSRPAEYRLTVHVFGATSSPSVANFALLQTVKDNPQYSINAKQAVTRSFYVDDLLSCTLDEQTACKLLIEVKELIANGGFSLTSIVTNSDSLHKLLATQGLASDMKDKTIIKENTDRALGLIWNTANDTLQFKANTEYKPLTRRGILSTIHGIYDPLGLTGPAIVPAKKIFQDSCRHQLNWDAELPNDLRDRWNNWATDLPLLENFTLPRCYKPSHAKQTDLHYFSDGSETAYGAVVYARFVLDNNEICVTPILAKSRLTPLNNSTFRTIPRIELNGAKLSILLKHVLQEELDYSIGNEYFWTDSYTVLKYINCEDKRFVKFVANRVSFIRSNSSTTQWMYVPSSQNPADCLSRGTSIRKLCTLNLWKNGPSFLRSAETEWPQQPVLNDIGLDNLEIKLKGTCGLTIAQPECSTINPLDKLIDSTSSWYKLKCRVAWLLRLKRMLAKTGNFTKGSLTIHELNDAENAIFCYIQQKHFASTIKLLQESKPLTRKHELRKLSPFIDTDGLLKVRGRLQNSALSIKAKHPIILPKNDKTVYRIVECFHKSLGHMGRETLVASLRGRYWIVGINRVIRKLLKDCVTCRKQNARPIHPKMANLPTDRVTSDNPPFTSTGLDYFGPFEVINGRKREKRYGVVFTCLSSRAMHIEMAYSLSTDSFINAFRRFQARRGNVKLVRSDNGTNLTSGEKELRLAIKNWNSSAVDNWMLQRGINWKFQPPSASHFGGTFEREIRSIKKVLRSLLDEQPLKLTDEALNTLFCEVECILNCRPLTVLSQASDDLEALTPNHLLLLHAGVTFPPGVFTIEDSYLTRRWKQVQYLSDLFWYRWKREYLPILQQKQKWHNDTYNYKIGDIVLLTEQLLPRNQWSLGRVIGLYPDASGVVRVVRVRVAKHKNCKIKGSFGTVELDRPVSKLLLLKSYEQLHNG